MSDEEQGEDNGAGDVGRPPAPDLTPQGSSHEYATGARRDENPFSLRQFLGGGAVGYERTGARPKTYSTGADAAPSLPDFVQDHMLESHPEPLSLDLTDTARHRALPPLDLPPLNGGAGGECALPDFLPPHAGAGARAGRASPEQAASDPVVSGAVQRLQAQLDSTRAELGAARALAARLQREAHELRAQLREARRAHAHPPRRGAAEAPTAEAECAGTEAQLRAEVQRLRESESAARREAGEARREAGEVRARAAGAGRELRLATDATEASLRDLLAGLQHLRDLSCALEPP